MRFGWDEIDEANQTDLMSFATAAMQALINVRPGIVEKAAIAETAWEMAEAMLDRRTRRTFAFSTGDESENQEPKP